MSAGLLETRLQILRRSVAEMQSAIEQHGGNRAGVADAKRRAVAVASASTTPDALVKGVKTMRELIDEVDAEMMTADEVMPAVNELVTQLETLLTQAIDANRAVQSQIAGISRFLTDLLGRSVQNVDAATKNLDEVIAQAKATTESNLAGLDTLIDDPAWDRFLACALPDVEQLFSEYIDLLGGIAIRERGLAPGPGSAYRLDQFCSMSDHLVLKEIVPTCRSRVSSLSIPGRALSHGAAWPLLRLGLAQYSVWGIPLQAYEFGRLVTATIESAGDPQTTAAIERFHAEGVRTLAADAFAALTVGPAYACALLYLRLVPKCRSEDDPGLDPYRAHVVREVLERVSEEESAGSDYREFVADVFDDWRQALVSTGSDAALDEADAGHLRSVIVRVQATLNQTFDLRQWKVSKALWEKTISSNSGGSSPSEELVVNEQRVGIRHLLNTAWLGRLQQDRIDPAEVERIERVTTDIGFRIVSPRGAYSSASTVPGSPGQRGAASQPSPTGPTSIPVGGAEKALLRSLGQADEREATVP